MADDLLNIPKDTAFLQSAVEPVQAEPAPIESTPEEKEQSLDDALNEKADSSNGDDKFASKFAALSRRDKELHQRERDLETKLAEIENRTKETDDKYSHYQNLEERFRKEPLKILEENNLTFEQLAEMVINDGKATNDMKFSDLDSKYAKRIEDLENKIAEKDKKSEEEKHNNVIEDFMLDLSDFVTENAQEYELIKANDSVGLIYQVIEEHHKENGRILSNKEAADHVEQYLEEEVKKHLALDKVQKMLGTEPKSEPEQESQPSVTLTNTDASTVPTRTDRKLNRDQSITEAAKLIRWNG